MRVYAVIDRASWCWRATAFELSAALRRHDVFITAEPRIDEAEASDLVWLRGYASLWPDVLRLSVPWCWGITSGGARTEYQIHRHERYLPGAAMVFAQNQGMAAALRAHGVRADRIAVVPNGVDVGRFSPALQSPETVAVGMAANLHRERWHNKGGDVTVDACERAGMLLRLATTGTGGKATEYEIGDLGRNAMPAFYRQLSIYCMPSLAEGCSNSLHEAMATGLPAVICRESGYHGEVCRDGRADRWGEVLFADRENAASVADALCYLRDRPADRARIGRNARRFAVRHAWPVIARQMEAAFLQAIENHNEAKTQYAEKDVTP